METPKTPKEFADLANRIRNRSYEDQGEPRTLIKKFLFEAPPRDLLEFIHHANEEWHPSAKTALDVRLGEDQAKAAKIMERQTNRLITLTWVLAILTAGLFAVEIRAVMFPQNTAEQPKANQTTQNAEIVVPPCPK